VRAVAVDLDALGDTRRLWRDFLADSARRYASIAALEPEDLPEDRAPVYLRPNAEASASLRALGAAGRRVGVFTDAPEALAEIALAHLGVSRRIEAVEAGAGARERLLGRLGDDAVVAETLGDLAKISGNAD
jgi:phosphoglycolate phosphatase-like HAD superfamily hydrolase